jgi:antitoxin component of MazEF toxin-antitoxin module
MTPPQTPSSRNFVITKKIAKHGNQAVIVIPAVLRDKINHGMLVKVTIDVLEERLGGETQ